MAEVLGIVASGLAVQQTAVQLAQSLIRLRQLWAEIRDAPVQIQDLMTDLSAFTALLSEMEGQLDENNPTARQSAQLCKNALIQLETVTSALDAQLNSSRRSKRLMGALKVVVSREDMKRYEDRLQRAFRLLQMSHQCCISASTRALPDIVAERLSVELQRYHQEKLRLVQQSVVAVVKREDEQETAPDNQTTDGGSRQGRVMPPEKRGAQLSKTWSVLRDMFVLKGSAESGSWELSFRPPIMQRVWNIQATRTYGGWKYVFRHGVLMSDSLWDCIELDDPAAVLRLFESKECSPYDYSDEGDSLFLTCAKRQCSNVMTMLLKRGLFDDGEVEAWFAERCPPYYYIQGLVDPQGDLIRLLHHLGIELQWHAAGTEFSRYYLASLLGVKAFRVWQRLYYPQYYELPVDVRWSLCRRIATRLNFFGLPRRHAEFAIRIPEIETLKGVIEARWDTASEEKLIAQSVECGYSLLGSVAYIFGWLSAWPVSWEMMGYPVISEMVNELQDWARDIISLKPALLHPVEVYPKRFTFDDQDRWSAPLFTPLWSVFSGGLWAIYRLGGWYGDRKDRIRPPGNLIVGALYGLKRWLDLLRCCGVDLEQYGRMERDLVSNDQVTRDWCIDVSWLLDVYEGPRCWLRVIGIEIGPSPEDWRIWWAFEYEMYARDFWDMVEKTASELAIPGSWVD